MTADPRVTAAREYLDAIRPYKVSDRPHSVLVREDAELRRMLAAVLAVPGAAAPALGAGERETLGAALADAVYYRESGCDRACADCDASPGGLCWDHAADLDRADAYMALAASLGIEVER